MMRRDVYTEEHELFRDQFRKFAAKEIEPKIAKWNHDGITDRETWQRMGQAGFLAPCMPEEYGGAGVDFRYDAIVTEELTYMRAHGIMTTVHASICLPYLVSFGTEAQKQKYIPPAVRGDLLLGIGMTEPGAGSDLANIQTKAIRDGDHYVVNGGKTFISLGQLGGLYVTAVKTDPSARPAHRGVSLLLIEADTPGFVRGRKLEKLGFPAQDTSELFFEDCRVPVENLLGEEGQGFKLMMEKLQQERLSIGVTAMASCRRALDDTIAYVQQRKAFGTPIAHFQNTQFKLAELATQIQIGQSFVDQLLLAHVRGDEIVSEVSMAKWWTTDLQKKVTGECLQLHGGYGFMLEYPISMDFADAAVQSIYAGSNEIMKVIIARRMGLGG